MNGEEMIDSMESRGHESMSHAEAFFNINYAALWELNLKTKQLICSAGFYTTLGYEPDENAITYADFVNVILYHEDVSLLLGEVYNCGINAVKTLDVRLLTKDGYQWFQVSFKSEKESFVGGSIVNIHPFKTSTSKLIADKVKYSSINKIANAGIWEIDIKSRKIWLSEEMYHVLEISDRPELSIKTILLYFIPEHRPVLMESLDASIIKCKPFDLELQVNTGMNNCLWVRVKAVTVIDELGNGRTVKGVLQNIDRQKQKEEALKSSFDSTEHQNKRLQNFAYIVSHNLRSHTNNLQYLVRLYQEEKESEGAEEIFKHISTISNSLSTTIEHLNQIVKIETDIKEERQLIEFKLAFTNVTRALENIIQSNDAVIVSNFSECPTIRYIPAYLESIFHNLLTNALKYRHPERYPVITCQTFLEDGDVYLVFKDNGIGIDLNRYGEKIFGMYQTFHSNSDSKGIGLFITRNQIEALGGSIQVESNVGEGTTFIINFGKQS